MKVRKEEVRDVWKEGSQSIQDAVEEQEGEQWAVEVQQSEQEAVQKQWNHPPMNRLSRPSTLVAPLATNAHKAGLHFSHGRLSF